MSARSRRIAVAVVAFAALVTAPTAAGAATRNGVTPSSPAAGAVVPVGQAVTFKGRVRGEGVVYVHVCKSPRKSAREGLICTDAVIGKARKADGRFSYRQRSYAFDEYWLNTPGTYYWQAHRIACEDRDFRDCRQEGPVVKFRVG